MPPKASPRHFIFLHKYLHYVNWSAIYPESLTRLVMREFSLCLADARGVVDDMFKRLGLDTESGTCVRYCYAIAYNDRQDFYVQDCFCMTKKSDVDERDRLAADHRFIDFVDVILVLDIPSDLLKGGGE